MLKERASTSTQLLIGLRSLSCLQNMSSVHDEDYKMLRICMHDLAAFIEIGSQKLFSGGMMRME